MIKNPERFHFKITKTFIWLGIGLALLLVLLALFLNDSNYYSPTDVTTSFIQEATAKQQKIEADIQSYYQAGTFTFTQPLVIQDPYQTAPLTALVIFDTAEDSQISIHVPGLRAEAEVNFTFPGFLKHHEIAVYGLYADKLNHVTLTMRTRDGKSAQNIIDLQTEPLLASLQRFQVDQVIQNRYSPGFNFTATDHKQVFDIDGNVRWYSTQASDFVFTPLKNGRFLFIFTLSGQPNSIVMEEDLLGKIYSIYNAVDGIHHDICELPSGNLLITSGNAKSTTVQDYLLEIDRSSGHVLRSFDIKNYLDPNRPNEIDRYDSDWLHLNSVVYDPVDQSIIISSKAQSAVVKFSYPDMQIKWILGPHDNWSPKYQPYLLTPLGDPFEWSWSQHDATLYSVDSPGADTVDILLFDNGMYRSFDSKNALSPTDSYSRVVHYSINEASLTISQVWEYGKENGSSTFSSVRGGAQQLSNGDVLGNWGSISKDAQGNALAIKDKAGSINTRITEIDPSSNTVVFDASAENTITYRAFRAEIYAGYSEQNESLTTPIKNYSGYDFIDRMDVVNRDLHVWIPQLATSLKQISLKWMAEISSFAANLR